MVGLLRHPQLINMKQNEYLGIEVGTYVYLSENRPTINLKGDHAFMLKILTKASLIFHLPNVILVSRRKFPDMESLG
jgi:hypothetical protein